MKSYAKSTAAAIAVSIIAICSNAHAAGNPPSGRHVQIAGGMQNKAAMMTMIKQISSSFAGPGNSFLPGNINPADLLSQLGR